MLPSRYPPGSHISSTRPDPTFLVLAQIPHFQYSPGSYLFRYSPGCYLPGTSPDPTFLVLDQIPYFWYSPGSPISGTRSDPTFSGTHPDFTFRYYPGSYLFQHRPRISLSFLVLCPDHSSSQALCLVFFKSFNRGDFVPLVFGTK